ncbi:DUF2063 domain-containing protein [Loktanella sp. 3ANDIMAR09]|uniref:HvfC/BufC N-terminal domain-containing protein n=1 Tax=Loktanella sp. 3ANDIMAR09 TaxID=1225657 RepID=UPI000701B475|nr:DNA-binding domain-containing protein [Loktanella sp. 3ANDIMAR09]
MHAHLETQTAFRNGLKTGAVPPGITAVGDVERRFSVYRNTVAHSLTDALCQRFPTVLRLVGDAFFRATAGVFVAENPPQSAILHDYGTAFPEFLAGFPPAATLPYLPDIARIEVLRGQAYHAADALPMTAQSISDALAAGPEERGLTLHPSVRVITSDHPVVAIWAMNQPGATPRPVPPEPQAALMFRLGENIPVVGVTADTAGIVTRLLAGERLGTACADVPPQVASVAIGLLIQHGLIIQVTQT